MDTVRYIKFDGAANFREIGGLKTASGSMKSGILFRSDDLSRLTKNDLQILNALKLKTVIDLRTPNERKSKPDRLPANESIRIVNVPFYHQKRDVNQLKIMWFLITNSPKLNFEKFIKEHYYNNAFTRASEIAQIINLLSDETNLPALIHCAAGKDRTGLLSALLQMLSGVDYEIIIDEYLSTNNFMKKQMAETEKIIRRMSFFRISSERIKPLLEVRREYLEEIISEIYKRFGSIENYFTQHCNINFAVIQNIKRLIAE